LAAGRYAWVQIGAGSVELNGRKLETGDGAAIAEETALTITATAETDLLLFDLA
jgi:redox-sensitive bicupin YhaK (pirin superfamily)